MKIFALAFVLTLAPMVSALTGDVECPKNHTLYTAEDYGFPSTWTYFPQFQMQDCVRWPGNWGAGSSTVREWILDNEKRDYENRPKAVEFDNPRLEDEISTSAAAPGDRVVTKKYVAIPKGATNRNFQGYWQDGFWSIVTNNAGKQRLQIVQTLHIPDFKKDYYYMQWGQVEREGYINGTDTEKEGWVCTAVNTARARHDLTNLDYYRVGHLGFDRIADSNNETYNYISWRTRTQKYPMICDDSRCSLGIIGDQKFDPYNGDPLPTEGFVTITQWRDFISDWSVIRLKFNQEFVW